jgi:hypothetical protein
MANCPICKLQKKKLISNFDCGRFDDSKLYTAVRILSCSCCGHIFNGLKDYEIKGLHDYYNSEYALINLDDTEKSGKYTGSLNKFDNERFSYLLKILKSYLNTDSKILDIACKTGGFLSFLKDSGFVNLSGIDNIC